MASLNLSTNGPSITKSYQAVVNSPLPSGPAANSLTYGQWAIFSVSAPLVNAFQQDSGGKESVLKVQSTGEGELIDLIDEFSDGRIQFAFVKVRDPNTKLAKNVLVGWCGEGVPERTKGYFTSHLAAVAKVLHGHHVQVTARSDRDLTPEGIVQKVSQASGANYSGGSTSDASNKAAQPPPPKPSKSAFTPTRTAGGSSGFNPLAGARSRAGGASRGVDAGEDGWGDDAPPVTRTQLEKVQSAYQPTKVNMTELMKQKQEPSRFSGRAENSSPERDDVVKGSYQPVGKVNIAEIRRKAQEARDAGDDRPAPVKGAYEPVGKVDIAAIRARAKQEPAQPTTAQNAPPASGDKVHPSPSNQSSTYNQSERLTSLPKPKVANRFGAGAGNFTGTKAPTPGGFGLESKQTSASTPAGAVSRTFADKGGKTPAQLWAEKKARERGESVSSDTPPAAPVQPSSTGHSGASAHDDRSEEDVRPSPGGVGALRDRFKGGTPMGAPTSSRSPVDHGSAPSPPPLNTATKPNASSSGSNEPAPGLPIRPAEQSQDEQEEEEEHGSRMPPPPAQRRSPTPPTPPAMRPSSPIRVAMPISRGQPSEIEAPDERLSQPPVPVESISKRVPQEDLMDEPEGRDPARAAGEAAAAASFGEAAHNADPGARTSGKTALIQYDYEKAEDNEIELREGEYVTNIEMVDEDWWMGQNSQGETGLFPSNYVELVEDDDDVHDHAGAHLHEEEQHQATTPLAPSPPAAAAHDQPSGKAAATGAQGPTAIALYDYEAAEENELSFAEGDKITGVEFPDEDWWFGHLDHAEGLFPANYVQLEGT